MHRLPVQRFQLRLRHPAAQQGVGGLARRDRYQRFAGAFLVERRIAGGLSGEAAQPEGAQQHRLAQDPALHLVHRHMRAQPGEQPAFGGEPDAFFVQGEAMEAQHGEDHAKQTQGQRGQAEQQDRGDQEGQPEHHAAQPAVDRLHAVGRPASDVAHVELPRRAEHGGDDDHPAVAGEPQPDQMAQRHAQQRFRVHPARVRRRCIVP